MLSIVIPVHNEEALLVRAVSELEGKLAGLGWDYEIILCENGSSDQTLALAQGLGETSGRVRALHADAPNYGRALRQGIETARGETVICDEIDLCDVDFYRRALPLLAGGADLVVGSKRHPDSADHRPWVRRAGTATINGLLRLSLGFRGTDTHGLKAFKRERLAGVVARCIVEHDLFASELVIRAGHAELDVREIPLDLRELRPPSIHLVRRVPRVLVNLARLVYAIRLKG
jgi:glycosyltransferase involved in cell wall biosynthesis